VSRAFTPRRVRTLEGAVSCAQFDPERDGDGFDYGSVTAKINDGDRALLGIPTTTRHARADRRHDAARRRQHADARIKLEASAASAPTSKSQSTSGAAPQDDLLGVTRSRLGAGRRVAPQARPYESWRSSRCLMRAADDARLSVDGGVIRAHPGAFCSSRSPI
jgi:hypothetical protein